MAQEIINVGASVGDVTADPNRTAWQKTNSNFTELYNGVSGLRGLSRTQQSATSGGTWGPRDGAKLMFLGNTAYLLGGWAGGLYDDDWPDAGFPTTNQVHRSTDFGITWTRIVNHANTPGPTQFSHRHWFAAINHTVGGVEYMYLLNGDAGDVNQGPINSDVRRSTDGITWTKMNTVEPGYHGTILMTPGVLNGVLYLVGGQADLTAATATNVVWRSFDNGVTWESMGAAPWAVRFGPDQLVEHDGKLWLIGGGLYDNTAANRVFYNDVWSFDGTTWTQELANGHDQFPGRTYHNVFKYDGWIYLVRGSTRVNGVLQTNSSFAHRSRDGIRWESVDLDLPASHADGIAVHSTGWLVTSGNYALQGSPSNTNSSSTFFAHDKEYTDGVVDVAQGTALNTILQYQYDTFLLGFTEGTSPRKPTPGTNNKLAALVARHRQQNEESVEMIGCYSLSGQNIVSIGGGTLGTTNAATSIDMYLGANETTLVGVRKARLESNGLRIADRLQVGTSSIAILTGLAANIYGCHWLVGATESATAQARTENTAKQWSLRIPTFTASSNNDGWIGMHCYSTNTNHLMDYGWGISAVKAATRHSFYVGASVSATTATETVRIDNTATTAENTGLLLLLDGSLKRVVAGASDSGGTGFRLLRVAN